RIPFCLAPSSLQANHCAWERSRDSHANSNVAFPQLQIDRCVEIRLLDRTDFLDRVPILTPGLRLTWLQEAEVRLIVGISSSHDFDIGRKLAGGIGIGQVAIPGVAEIVVTPCPLLFPGSNMVVCIVDDSRLRRMIVTTEKIFL